MRLSDSGLKILKVCLDTAPSKLYGYELMQATGLASGTLYPLLMRFEKEGWLESSWEKCDPTVEGRPRRRLYWITATGQQVIREKLSVLVVHAVNSVTFSLPAQPTPEFGWRASSI